MAFNQEKALAKWAKKRAQRLGVSEKEAVSGASSSPFLEAMRERADRVGQTLAQVNEYKEEVLTTQTNYPGSECLTPFDVQQFATGTDMGQDQLKHLASCAGCHALLSMLNPEPARLVLFLESVRIEAASALTRVQSGELRVFGSAAIWERLEKLNKE